jgi:hypothetical protein
VPEVLRNNPKGETWPNLVTLVVENNLKRRHFRQKKQKKRENVKTIAKRYKGIQTEVFSPYQGDQMEL